ncbi:hypothetical protein EYW49_08175 [Siculibacillus lacustris]|uniref:Glycosyltransferase RgtA/B/C/D-like domain-containing protein n=1 Tax=Siculibacillus lacustris TaxID=1549641 RepID=A0A4Q9VRV5_9HYPH|nr:hypothetical protein [Siculibacillus lacustris]TBW38667.1 hypothetical protein EYW49_08175 [Siculibacillus lacustris]
MTELSAREPSPTSDRARRRNAVVEFLLAHEFSIAFVVLTAIVLVPVFQVAVPPLSDYVNHLARMYVIAVQGKDVHLDQFYKIEWQPIPNLAMDIVVPILARVVDIYRAGQVFTMLTILSLVTGPMAVHRALYGRFNPFPLTAFVILYNGVFLIGLMNYLIGVGVATWGLAFWIALQNSRPIVRMAVSAVFCVVLYVCHLYAVGLYGVTIGAFETWAWASRRFAFDRRLVRSLVVLIVPVLPLVPVLLSSSTWTLAGEYAWFSQSKMDGLSMVFRTYTDAYDLTVLWLAAAAFGWAIHKRLLSAHGAVVPLAAFGAAVFLAMPYTLFGSDMADQRLPVALLVMLVGFVRLDPEDKWSRAGFLVLVIGFALLRVGDVALQWSRIGAIYDDFRASLVDVPRGAKILVAYADEPKGTQAEQDAISHAPCVAMIERSALVSTAFTVKGKQIMTVRRAFRAQVDTEDGVPPTISQLVATSYVHDDEAPRDHFWDKWTDEDDFVFVLYTEREADNPDPSNLDLVHDGKGFQLYKIKH